MSVTGEIHVAAICGSLREKSYTRMSLNLALEGARMVGASTKMIDLRDYELAFCDGSDEYPPDVERLQQDVADAKGLIIGTPVYHGSYSGVLKNALDLLSFRELEGAIWGLLGVAGGGTGATVTMTHLRTIGRSLHAWVVPEEVSVANSSKQFDASGQCIDAALRERLLNLGRSVARFAYLHHAEQTQEFVRLWESNLSSPDDDY